MADIVESPSIPMVDCCYHMDGVSPPAFLVGFPPCFLFDSDMVPYSSYWVCILDYSISQHSLMGLLIKLWMGL